MVAMRRRRHYAIAPAYAVSGHEHSDPDPISSDHFMYVLDWQVAHPGHLLEKMDAYQLARLVRQIARTGIAEAIAEIEDCSGE